MSIKFDGKKIQDLTEEDIELVLDEPAETRRPIRFAHCLLFDSGSPPAVISAHYSKGMAGVILQDTKRSEVRVRAKEDIEMRLAFTGGSKDAGSVVMTVSDMEHQLLLEHDEGGSVLYVTPVRKHKQ